MQISTKLSEYLLYLLIKGRFPIESKHNIVFISKNKQCDKGASINYVDKQEGGRGFPNVNDTTEAYLVNLSTKGGGGVKNPQNSVNVVYGCPLSDSGYNANA